MVDGIPCEAREGGRMHPCPTSRMGRVKRYAMRGTVRGYSERLDTGPMRSAQRLPFESPRLYGQYTKLSDLYRGPVCPRVGRCLAAPWHGRGRGVRRGWRRYGRIRCPTDRVWAGRPLYGDESGLWVDPS